MTSTQRESADQLTGVAETLMITLYARYLETQCSDSFFQDPKAVEIVDRTDYNFNKYAKGWASQLGVVIRVQEYDRIAQQFLENHPNAVVVNLGCGLCTRFTRLDNGSVRWYEVDFPEVIEFRRKFFQESDRYRFIPTSILDFSWIDQIQRSADQPLLILMEGVSPYLSEAENRSLVLQICDRLAPAELVFDVLNCKSAKRTARHDTVSKTGAEFKSGIDSGREVETWADGITLQGEVYYLTQFANHPKRLPFWMRYLSFIMVPLFKNSGRILHLQIEKN
ncbi:class I SAM-dependent methyltransferase [Synechococcales cyanobacterium C]|uniref:Class I SAM-dependent methyltransferase n=1 Tax=Petrachloros mirabilis ULC683 TaxID=2781853 RepID=A0A8K2A9X0_9CYAN|nr:class I SAM-dependent methyltransferase [Petrachloros mirabilis]NCJ08709.1 class I SAM-dependent methyltransferase [Petrachloros mirabilis ULC683]